MDEFKQKWFQFILSCVFTVIMFIAATSQRGSEAEKKEYKDELNKKADKIEVIELKDDFTGKYSAINKRMDTHESNQKTELQQLRQDMKDIKKDINENTDSKFESVKELINALHRE